MILCSLAKETLTCMYGCLIISRSSPAAEDASIVRAPLFCRVVPDSIWSLGKT